MRIPRSSRAVTPVVSNVLLVATVVVLAATISVLALGFTEETTETGPVVGESSGNLVTQEGYDGGIVRLNHIAGDTLTVSNLEIVVDAQDACDKTGRLVNLPASGGDPVPTSKFVRGDDVFDNSYNSVGGPIGEARGEWEAGETATFRLAKSECQLDNGDEIIVRVVHTPTNSVVIKETLTAT
ncbi:flagellin (archaellin), FlaG/FlaF family [Halorientalis persicus]|uniref:Flagellin (Archaellin), FlaG/FlaF family n=1 Tax=Halorientalis persicus TaxID=1367881 RepID=A0A1H8GV19_9EURY|nr:type IV pilin [Halorientalis persicus]SEN47660.1 flagellin (archaellin), FlaG/FlaF family [Halorientalis persicus]